MRYVTLLLLMTMGITQISAAQPNQTLSGSYQGDIGGTASALTLERSGNSFSGLIDAGGYGYALDGTAGGSTGSGVLTDNQTGAAMEFEIVEQGGAVTVTILAADPNTGQAQRISFQFQRVDGSGFAQSAGGAAAGTVSPPNTEDASGGYRPAQPDRATNVERDPALVGAWSYSDTYMSGDFSATTRLFMQVNPDGSYAYGSGGVSAGLDNSSGSVYGNTGNSGDVTRGQWRTQGGVVYVMEAGSPQWVPYARYYVEGNSMMFTFANDKRQVWQRR